jgi:hypothetical protein
MLALLATRDYLDLGVEEKIPWSLIKFRGGIDRQAYPAYRSRPMRNLSWGR